ncbi:hypothetical protein GYMLUDRAFT_913826 [Collybiopsis luxurians FD-317 M1]|nr:hypothetical protein GYMLUDRAFT_913826 [Collybiopsis luxurians FD-317 M1]
MQGRGGYPYQGGGSYNPNSPPTNSNQRSYGSPYQPQPPYGSASGAPEAPTSGYYSQGAHPGYGQQYPSGHGTGGPGTAPGGPPGSYSGYPHSQAYPGSAGAAGMPGSHNAPVVPTSQGWSGPGPESRGVGSTYASGTRGTQQGWAGPSADRSAYSVQAGPSTTTRTVQQGWTGTGYAPGSAGNSRGNFPEYYLQRYHTARLSDSEFLDAAAGPPSHAYGGRTSVSHAMGLGTHYTPGPPPYQPPSGGAFNRQSSTSQQQQQTTLPSLVSAIPARTGVAIPGGGGERWQNPPQASGAASAGPSRQRATRSNATGSDDFVGHFSSESGTGTSPYVNTNIEPTAAGVKKCSKCQAIYVTSNVKEHVCKGSGSRKDDDSKGNDGNSGDKGKGKGKAKEK